MHLKHMYVNENYYISFDIESRGAIIELNCSGYVDDVLVFKLHDLNFLGCREEAVKLVLTDNDYCMTKALECINGYEKYSIGAI